MPKRCHDEMTMQELSKVNNKEHPYGVKPLGNMYFDETNENILQTSIGSFIQLKDILILDVLAWLSAEDICRMSAVSRGCYVFCHADILWRNLVLNEFGGDFKYSNSWKESYIRRKVPDFIGHVPIRLKNCYSDVLYKPWMHAVAMPIQESWLNKENIDRRSDLTLESFVEEYQSKSIPVILTDVMDSWKTKTNFNLEGMRKNKELLATKFKVSASMEMTMENYLEYASAATDERPLYLFDKDFAKKVPDMDEGYTRPVVFADDYMRALPRECRPDYRWLIVGPKRSGSSFHVDPNCNCAWSANIEGKKKWIIYPKNVEPPLDQDEVSLIQWFERHYDDDENKHLRYECISNPGEVVFVPHGCWHCVLNLEFTIAITHNVVTRHNLIESLDFLAAGEPCEPGTGCLGDVAINTSGDVPASVIFPYKDRVGQPVSQESSESPELEDVCHCIKKKRVLLRRLENALESKHPGLINEFREKLQISKQQSSSMWSKLGLDRDAPDREETIKSFSFGF